MIPVVVVTYRYLMVCHSCYCHHVGTKLVSPLPHKCGDSEFPISFLADHPLLR